MTGLVILLTQIGSQWHQILTDDNREPLPCLKKLCVSFHSQLWLRIPVTNRKRSNRNQIVSFSPRVTVTLIFDRWPWNNRALFLCYSSFVHHFKAISEFQLMLQSGNAQFGSKLAIFITRDLEIWQMTLKSNRAPLRCCLKLCESFHSHWSIQTGVTVQKRSIWVKIGDFFTVSLKIDHDLENNRAPFVCYFKLCASFHSHLEFKVELWSEMPKLGQNLFLPLWPYLWPPTLLIWMDITSVNGNNSWKFHDGTMTRTLLKRCDGQTDGWTTRQMDRSSIELLGRRYKMRGRNDCTPAASCLGLECQLWLLKLKRDSILSRHKCVIS